MKAWIIGFVVSAAFLLACEEESDGANGENPDAESASSANEKIEGYKEYLATLDKADVYSSQAAADSCLALMEGASPRDRDRLFAAFYDYHEDNLGETMNLVQLSFDERDSVAAYLTDDPDNDEGEKIYHHYAQSPFKIRFVEQEYYSHVFLLVDIQWLEETFEGKLGPESERFLEFLNYLERRPIRGVFALNLKNVEERMVAASKLMREQPEFLLYREVEYEYVHALIAYLTAINLKDGQYGLVKYDVTKDNKILTPEMRKVMKNFVENNPDTRAAHDVGEFYELIKANEWRLYGKPAQYTNNLMVEQMKLAHPINTGEM
ncbi:MAG: hypothetical protein GF419_03195 [Ignavibacteriales bacterium]|nr:hypothetical protein [Ignavibacteriales bacterium]